jgi:hypothetical protein
MTDLIGLFVAQILNNTTTRTPEPVNVTSDVCVVGNYNDALQQCVFPTLVAGVGGEAVFGVLIGGVLATALTVAGDGDLATPAVVTLLAGAVLVPLLPGQFVSLARAVVVVGIVAAILAVGQRWVT